MKTHVFPSGYIKSTVLLIAATVLCPAAAWANNPPDPIICAPWVVILLILAGCMSLGGVFTIMAADRLKRLIRYALILLFSIVIITVSSMLTGIYYMMLGLVIFFGPMLFVLACFLISLRYSAAMIAWGIEARRPPEKRRPFLMNANSPRLILFGTLATLSMIVVSHTSIVPERFNRVNIKYENISELSSLLEYQTDYSETLARETNHAEYALPDGQSWHYPNAYLYFKSHNFDFSHYRVEFVLAPDRSTFKVWLWPITFPYWPYNYILPMPSYFADQTGRIRMIKVHRPEKCPEDAPVVETIKP